MSTEWGQAHRGGGDYGERGGATIVECYGATWLLVRISPSGVRMMPNPRSDWPPTSVCSVTMLGITLAATSLTEEIGRLTPDRVGELRQVGAVRKRMDKQCRGRTD